MHIDLVAASAESAVYERVIKALRPRGRLEDLASAREETGGRLRDLLGFGLMSSASTL